MPHAPKPHRPRHAVPPARRRDDRRGSSTDRGYQGDRDAYKKAARIKRRLVPICEDCPPIPVVPSAVADHVIPLRGSRQERLADPLRLDPLNFRARCRSCHAKKTARHDVAIRREYDALRASGVPYEQARDQVLAKWIDVMVRER